MVTEKAKALIAGKFIAIAMVRLCLIWLLLIPLFFTATTQCLGGEQSGENEPRSTITLNLGAISSIAFPPSWKPDDSKGISVRRFTKPSNDLYDCAMSMQIGNAVKISSEQSKAFDALLSQARLNRQQVKSLADFPSSCFSSDGPNGSNGSSVRHALELGSDDLSATTSEINGKRVIIIEKNGSKRGPCQRTANGGSRMPLLSSVSDCVLVRVGVDAVQPIQFEVTIMGETKPCVNSVRASLNSIVWNKQTP